MTSASTGQVPRECTANPPLERTAAPVYFTCGRTWRGAGHPRPLDSIHYLGAEHACTWATKRRSSTTHRLRAFLAREVGGHFTGSSFAVHSGPLKSHRHGRSHQDNTYLAAHRFDSSAASGISYKPAIASSLTAVLVAAVATSHLAAQRRWRPILLLCLVAAPTGVMAGMLQVRRCRTRHFGPGAGRQLHRRRRKVRESAEDRALVVGIGSRAAHRRPV